MAPSRWATTIAITNANDAVAVGAHLAVQTPTQVVVGSHNDPASAAKFVVAGGAPGAPLNLLEVLADGTVVNAYLDALVTRVVALEAQLASALAGCAAPECAGHQGGVPRRRVLPGALEHVRARIFLP